jgi:hypothetical protein
MTVPSHTRKFSATPTHPDRATPDLDHLPLLTVRLDAPAKLTFM